MKIAEEFSPEYLSKAIAEVKKIKPDYALMFGLYENIFMAQEKAKSSIHIENFDTRQEVTALKIREGFPLIEIRSFQVDYEAAVDLLNELCGILSEGSEEISCSVNKITDIIRNDEMKPASFLRAFIEEDESFFDSIEEDYDIDKKLLGFLAYNSLKPSLQLFAQEMSRHLDKDFDWFRGYCPICGSMPELSVFGDNGKRSLVCGFCNHAWESKRIYCPFCENEDHDSIHYFELEDEEEYRVDVCDRCKKYIKTIDIKKTIRSVYLPLENITTPYIELKFSEMGFSPGNSISRQA